METTVETVLVEILNHLGIAMRTGGITGKFAALNVEAAYDEAVETLLKIRSPQEAT